MTLQNDPPTLDRGPTAKRKFTKTFKDMIDQCLQKDPTKRPTAEKLLQHPFFKNAKKPLILVDAVVKRVPPVSDRAHREPRMREDETLTESGTGKSSNQWDFSEEHQQKLIDLVEVSSVSGSLDRGSSGESLASQAPSETDTNNLNSSGNGGFRMPSQDAVTDASQQQPSSSSDVAPTVQQKKGRFVVEQMSSVSMDANGAQAGQGQTQPTTASTTANHSRQTSSGLPMIDSATKNTRSPSISSTSGTNVSISPVTSLPPGPVTPTTAATGTQSMDRASVPLSSAPSSATIGGGQQEVRKGRFSVTNEAANGPPPEDKGDDKRVRFSNDSEPIVLPAAGSNASAQPSGAVSQNPVSTQAPQSTQHPAHTSSHRNSISGGSKRISGEHSASIIQQSGSGNTMNPNESSRRGRFEVTSSSNASALSSPNNDSSVSGDGTVSPRLQPMPGSGTSHHIPLSAAMKQSTSRNVSSSFLPPAAMSSHQQQASAVLFEQLQMLLTQSEQQRSMLQTVIHKVYGPQPSAQQPNTDFSREVFQTIAALQSQIQQLVFENSALRRDNEQLKARLRSAQNLESIPSSRPGTAASTSASELQGSSGHLPPPPPSTDQAGNKQ